MSYPVKDLSRTNMALCNAETWRPPLFTPRGGGLGSLLAPLRRFFDVQAGSIWLDLKAILPTVEGPVIDVGCGAQPYRCLVPAHAEYVGIDTINAKEHFGYAVPDTRYYSGNRWPTADGYARLILCTETMEHVLSPEQLLAEAARCLGPGGTLLLTVPFAARWHFIPHDYWRFTPSGLDFLLRAADFHNIRVYARGNAVTVACYKVMALILRLALPDSEGLLTTFALRALACLCVPFLLVLATIARLSLYGTGGNDCLGYTAVAEKKYP